jgi:hypothetical protein
LFFCPPDIAELVHFIENTGYTKLGSGLQRHQFFCFYTDLFSNRYLDKEVMGLLLQACR